MSPEEMALGLKLVALAHGRLGSMGPELEQFIVEAVKLAVEHLKPQTVVVEAPKVTVDLSGLQNHENGGV